MCLTPRGQSFANFSHTGKHESRSLISCMCREAVIGALLELLEYEASNAEEQSKFKDLTVKCLIKVTKSLDDDIKTDRVTRGLVTVSVCCAPVPAHCLCEASSTFNYMEGITLARTNLRNHQCRTPAIRIQRSAAYPAGAGSEQDPAGHPWLLLQHDLPGDQGQRPAGRQAAAHGKDPPAQDLWPGGMPAGLASASFCSLLFDMS